MNIIKASNNIHGLNNCREKGFSALIAVVLLASGAMAFSIATLGSAMTFADLVNKREFRIQAGLNARACLDTIRIMALKDYFLNGTLNLREFGCVANVTNNNRGVLEASLVSKFNNVSAYINSEIII
ncbi:MAG: hypothetical protein WCV79_01560 [Candidatus Paceibacterota bacterium]|jgi:hypothetical protein